MAEPREALLRTWVVRITIGSFSVAALMGVAALVTGGEFGETEVRVLLTTLLVGAASVLVLCALTTAGTRARPVGAAGAAAALVMVAAALVLIWGRSDADAPMAVIRTFGVAAVLAVTLAQGSLLLTIGPHRSRLVVRLLIGTLALAAVLAVLVCVLVLGYEPDGSGYPRLLGVVAILDVLGTVVTAALAKFGGRGEPSESRRLTVPEDLSSRLLHLAETTGERPEALLRSTLEAGLDAASSPAGPDG